MSTGICEGSRGLQHMIDDERRHKVFALLISLSLMLDHGQGSEYTPAEFRGWCAEAGFRSVEVLPLVGPSSVGIAYK